MADSRNVAVKWADAKQWFRPVGYGDVPQRKSLAFLSHGVARTRLAWKSLIQYSRI